jgi:calcium-dependent protein kinase
MDEVTRRKYFSYNDAAHLIKCILKVLVQLDEKKVVHGNLKPESILLGQNETFERIKVTDFEGGFPVGSKMAKSSAPYYMAPELMLGQMTPKSDVWSVGVLAFLILSGVPPLRDDDENSVYDKVARGKFSFEDPSWAAVPNPAKDFILRSLRKDPKYRISAKEGLQHPWIRDADKPDPKSKEISKDAMSLLTRFNDSKILKQATY